MKPQLMLYSIDENGKIAFMPGNFAAPGPSDWPLVYTVAPSDPKQIADRVTVTLAGAEVVSLDIGEPPRTYIHEVTAGIASITFLVHVQKAAAKRHLQVVVPVPSQISLGTSLTIEFNLLPLPPPRLPQQGSKPTRSRLPPPQLAEPTIDTRPARRTGRPAPAKNP